jgi:hypothetical protein
MIQNGTRFMQHERIALNVLSTSSDHSRCLQLADLVASCTLATIGGENRFAPTTFALIKPLLCEDMGRIGGVGLKIHPDFKYANLYHWLCGDEFLKRGNVAHPLPDIGTPYPRDPFKA